jgi:hypothetical protein
MRLLDDRLHASYQAVRSRHHALEDFLDTRLPSERGIVEGKSVQADFKKFAGIHGSDTRNGLIALAVELNV